MARRIRLALEADEGQDLIEYALLVGLIAIICIGAITLTGQSVSTFFWQGIADAIPS